MTRRLWREGLLGGGTVCVSSVSDGVIECSKVCSLRVTTNLLSSRCGTKLTRRRRPVMTMTMTMLLLLALKAFITSSTDVQQSSLRLHTESTTAD